MIRFRGAASLALGILAAAGCAKSASSTADTSAAPSVAAAPAPDAAADEQAVRAINPAWFKAYNDRNVDAIVALYADDAILSVPGQKMAQGPDAIRQAYAKDIAAATKDGLSNTSGPDPRFKVSGDLAWESNTFTVTNKAGKTVATGKYVTVFERNNGKWAIVQDIWNLDA